MYTYKLYRQGMGVKTYKKNYSAIRNFQSFVIEHPDKTAMLIQYRDKVRTGRMYVHRNNETRDIDEIEGKNHMVIFWSL